MAEESVGGIGVCVCGGGGGGDRIILARSSVHVRISEWASMQYMNNNYVMSIHIVNTC